jgi:hypothetical protein
VETTVVAAPDATLGPDLVPGTVDFGTGAEDSCEVTGASTTFPVGTPVWWYAHFETYLPGDATVITTLTKDDVELDRTTGPDDASDQEWNGLCAGEGLKFYGLGRYDFLVWDSTETVLLAKGSYEIVPAAP